MSRFSERSAIEDYFIEQLTKESIGWTFVPADQLDRDSLEEPLLLKNLIRQIRKVNSDVELSDEDISNVLRLLKFKPSTQQGIMDILHLFKEGVSIKLEKGKVLYRVKLFDYKEITNNEFIVTRQAHYTNGDRRIIVDIILYVNGIPIVNIECKNPTSIAEDWTHAYNDIKSYEQEIPELYKYVQLGVAAAETARYFAIVRWQEYVDTDQWKIKGLDAVDSTILMLKTDTLLDILKNFLFYRIEFGNATKVVTRYMQYEAVNLIVNRVLDNIQGKGEKKRGLIWHWQGSGKTLDMIFAANKLHQHQLMENPTIFFIVDREDLEEQLDQEYNALDIDKPEVIGSIYALQQVIKHDNYRGKRGLFITLIHKFRPDELEPIERKLRELSKTQETITTRKNVIAWTDECHRSQYGQLAAQMKSILGEDTTFFFGFTGTPISKPKKGVDTYSEYAYPPEEKFLHKYFITESINDGFTVKIAYQPALEQKEGINLKKEMLDNFLNQEYDEIPDELRDDVKSEVKRRLNIIKVYLENPQRIKVVAADIAKHYQENLDGKFKAMVVAISREACVMYKRELDKLLPPEYSEIVMSYDEKKDSNAIKKFKEELRARYNGKEIDLIKKDIINKYKEADSPLKILIVKDMLLQGFNAPILQTMYLDQPLKEHRLLQAIARTNRPYKGLKEAGVIIDYIGFLREFRRAFAMYSKEDYKGAIYPPEELKKEFIEKVTSTMELFKDIPKDKFDRVTMLKAIEILTSDDQTGKKFIEDYKKMRRLFELLGSHVIKAELVFEYGWITQIYNIYIKIVFGTRGKEQLYVQRYFSKTIKYIYNTTELAELDKTLPMVEFDQNYIKKLNEIAKSKEEKAANLVFTLNRLVLVERSTNAVFETISGKVEKLLQLWKQKNRNFKKILQDGLLIYSELEALKTRQRELQFTDMEYGMLLALENKFGKKSELIEDVQSLHKELEKQMFPGWSSLLTSRKTIEKTIRTFMRQYIKKYGISLDEMEVLFKKLCDSVIKYA